MSVPFFNPESIAAEIVRQFEHSQLNEAECRQTVGRILKPSPVCPNSICKISLTDPERDRLYAGKSLICTGCGVKHSLRSGTHLNGIHCDYRQMMLVVVMKHWGVPAPAISKAAGVSTATVRRLVERFQYTSFTGLL